ncbi:gas vesicle protein GvpJ, partial [Actinopolymorpha pittospori]
MPERTTLASNQGTSLADLLDRVVDRGAFVSGDVIIQLAGIDLIRLDLRLLLVGIETAHELDNG